MTTALAVRVLFDRGIGIIVESRDFLTEADPPQGGKLEVQQDQLKGGIVVDINATKTIESSGKYVVALSGRMIPGEVYVNGELIFSFYTDEGDATVLLYLMKGDSVQVVGAEHSIRKVEYA